MNDTTITVTEATKILNVSGETVKRWLRKGKLTGYKADGQWFIETDDSMFERQVNDKCATREQQLFHTCVADEHLRDENTRLHKLLESQAKQLDQAQQLLAVQTKTNAALTDRLQAIEDMRSRSWFKRLFRR